MRDHTAPVGSAFMTLGVFGAGILATVASTSDKAAGDWHKTWFLLLISLCGLVAVAGLYIVCAGAITALPPKSWTPRESSTTDKEDEMNGGIFPDVEFDIRGIGGEVTTMPPRVPKSFREKHPDFEVKGIIVTLLGVRITNHDPNRAVSLTFKMSGKLEPGSFDDVDYMPLDQVPATGPPFLSMPVDVRPHGGAGGDIAFYDSGRWHWADEGWRIEVEDHLSGLTTPLPRMGKWRPAKDGEWTGAFPPPLQIDVEEYRWRNFRYLALILEAKIRLTNRTDQPIRVASFALTTEQRSPQWSVSGNDWAAIQREVAQIEDRLPQLNRHSQLDPDESESGWIVHAFGRPESGTPAFAIIIRDEVGNDYRKDVDTEEAQEFSS